MGIGQRTIWRPDPLGTPTPSRALGACVKSLSGSRDAPRKWVAKTARADALRFRRYEMEKPENSRFGLQSGRGRLSSARDKLKNKRVKTQAIISQQSIQTAAAIARAARRAAALRGTKCRVCGKRMAEGVQFCSACGAARTARASAKPQAGSGVKKPNVFRRVLAQAIDRLVTLPFLVLVYSGWPKWMWGAVGVHLLCDAFTGRGPGKWICRLRVADARSLAKCGGARAILRRVGVAAAQAAYCHWETLPFALGYDFLSFLFVWRDPAGQRLEDKLLGTRVLGEGAFRKRKWECGTCGNQVAARARFCPKCGNRPRQV